MSYNNTIQSPFAFKFFFLCGVEIIGIQDYDFDVGGAEFEHELFIGPRITQSPRKSANLIENWGAFWSDPTKNQFCYEA